MLLVHVPGHDSLPCPQQDMEVPSLSNGHLTTPWEDSQLLSSSCILVVHFLFTYRIFRAFRIHYRITVSQRDDCTMAGIELLG